MKLIADMEKRVRLMDIVKEAGLVSVVSMALKDDSTMAAKTIDAMSHSAMSASVTLQVPDDQRLNPPMERLNFSLSGLSESLTFSLGLPKISKLSISIIPGDLSANFSPMVLV